MVEPRFRLRQALAGLIAAVALMVASVSWVGFGLVHTALDAERSERVADALLSDAAVRDQLRANLAAAVAATVPGTAAADRARLDAWAGRVLESPALETVVGEALVRTHAAFLGEGEVPETLDLTGVIGQAHEAAVAASPALAGAVPVPRELVVDLPTGQVPDVGWLRRGLDRYVPVGAALAATGLVLALLVATHRPSILRRSGYWAIGAAATWLLVGVGVPWIATRLFAGQAVIAGALVESLVGGMVGPALWLAGAGLVALAGAVVWFSVDPLPPAPSVPPPVTVVVQPPVSGPPVAPVTVPAPAAASPVPASPAPVPTPAPAPAALSTHTPAPPWIEGIGYVDPVPPPPRRVPGVGHRDDGATPG